MRVPLSWLAEYVELVPGTTPEDVHAALVRVGLEDNFYLRNGEVAKSNGELIAKARQMCEDAGRRPATVDEARALLGLAKPEVSRRDLLKGEVA